MVGFGDRGSGAGLVDEVLAGGAGGNERGEGEPVDAAGFAAAGFVDERDGVVGEQRVGSTRELQVVVEVSGGFLAGHAGHGAAHGDALFECGQGAQGHFGGERGLAEKYCGKRGFGVEPVIGQQPQRFQGIVGEEVGLLDFSDRGRPYYASDQRLCVDYMFAMLAWRYDTRCCRGIEEGCRSG